MAKFTFKGWTFTEFLKGNKEWLKIALPAVLAYLVTTDYTWTAGATILGKALLDIIDYYQSE